MRKKYYSDYFEANMSNIKNKKKTWTGINQLSFCRKKELNTIIEIKDPIYKNKLVKDFSHIPNIAKEHFASVGSKLASKIPSSQQHYLDFVNKTMSPIPSSFFQPITYDYLKTDILSLPCKKITRFILLSDKATKMLNWHHSPCSFGTIYYFYQPREIPYKIEIIQKCARF